MASMLLTRKRVACRVSIPTASVAIAIAVTSALGCSSTDTTTAPTAPKCGVSLTLKQASMEPTGGAGSVTVTTQPECAWTAASEAPWITGVTPASGQGSGEVQFQVAPNPNGTAREGTIVLNDIRARVSQTGAECDVTISPANQSLSATTGSGTIAVAAPAGCAWSASSNAAWLVITSGASGSGSGTVAFQATANTGGARTGAISVAGRSFELTQQAVGTPACQFSIQPSSVSLGAAGGLSPITVQASTGCAWTSSSQAGWVTFSGASGGTSNGVVTIIAAANTGASRSGNVTIAGQALTVTQQGVTAPLCQFSIQPTSVSIGAGGGTAPITVQAGAGCAWTSSSQASWVTFSGSSSGSGNGTVTISAAANTGGARNGNVTIAGQTLAVTQAAPCAVSIASSSQTVAAGGGNGTAIGVTAAAGCTWTSTRSDTWITITGGASGSGNGTVTFTAAANTGPARTATITIGGQIHTVTQSSGCSYSLSSTSLSLGKNQSSGRTVNVITTPGCTWTATANASWLTITEGASGSGNGTVRFDVDRNDTNNPRIGTLTIAGITFTVNQND